MIRGIASPEAYPHHFDVGGKQARQAATFRLPEAHDIPLGASHVTRDIDDLTLGATEAQMPDDMTHAQGAFSPGLGTVKLYRV
jgi:hypothetical protein